MKNENIIDATLISLLLLLLLRNFMNCMKLKKKERYIGIKVFFEKICLYHNIIRIKAFGQM